MNNFLRVTDIAQELELSPGRIYQLIRAKKLPACKIGGAILVPKAAWDEWLCTQSQVALDSIQEYGHAEATA